MCEGNFHGRTIAVISASTDPDANRNYGPYLPGYIIIPYNNLEALSNALKDPDVAGSLCGADTRRSRRGSSGGGLPVESV